MDLQPTLPIPISFISGRYLLFSIDAVTYLRREHNICGVLIGTLPQIPQQNVFLSLPLELMPEEARVLVDKGVACIVDEAKAHNGIQSLLEEDRRQYLHELESQGLEASRIVAERKEQKKGESFKRHREKKAKNNANVQSKETTSGDATVVSSAGPSTANDEPASLGDFFADNASTPRTTSADTPDPRKAYGVTPATSYPPLPHPSTTPEVTLSRPDVPLSYPLFAHMHSRGYFLSPGLRFGCQYVAYPGDPLRFHSHFLVVSAEWDQEINLMDIVIGGRLGTGVKKGFLLGGSKKEKPEDGSEIERTENVRTFSIEWAGM